MPGKKSSYAGGITFYQTAAVRHDRLRSFCSWLACTAAGIAAAAVCVYFWGLQITMMDRSMVPAFARNQQVLVDRLSYRFSLPEAGDVIAFYPGGNEEEYPQVRRVVAVPGETVQVRDGVFLINGTPRPGNEEYLYITDEGTIASPLLLGENEYFVLGDNTNSSEDSRSASIGTVLPSYMIGKVWLALP